MALIALLASGEVSNVRDGAALLMVNHEVVSHWLACGAKVSRGEALDDADESQAQTYHEYFLRYCAAQAHAHRVLRRTLYADAVLDPRLALQIVKDERSAEKHRAEMRLLRQQERAGAFAVRAAEINLRKTEANAKIAEVMALLAAAKLRKINGRLYWPADLWAKMTPFEQDILKTIMERERLVPATREEAEEEAAQRGEQDDADIAALAQQWGIEFDDNDNKGPS